ncbi:MAG: helix-turn-helix domain-containing protein [Luteitalea sp.]|nr:helix-turn-helix domain-containing protein [Luteitalea sp.]
MRPAPPRAASAWRDVLSHCDQLEFQPHDIAAQLDPGGRYEMRLDEEFGFAITLFHYTSRQHTRGTTWHERLELFLPLDGVTRFRMGDKDVTLQPGDLLVVDNLKLHHVVDFAGFDTRAIVVSFRPDFVYSLGSPAHDYAFLLPFYPRPGRRPRVLALPEHPEAAAALDRLLTWRFGDTQGPLHRAGCRAFLLELLLELARRSAGAGPPPWELLRQQQRSLRLKPLFDHIAARYADKLSVSRAAALAGMTRPQLMKTFKKVAGLTLLAYLNHVRLANALRLLRDTDLTIGEIASAVGFSDQSYFDKRFKRAFGQTPKDFRTGTDGSKSSKDPTRAF